MKQFETYRGFVYPWCIDHVGHMNVQSYVARFDEASWHFLARLGLTPSFLSAQQRSLVALDQRIQYHREVMQGTLLDICTELVEVKEKTLRYQHRMRNSESTQDLATMDLLVGYLDRATRRMTVLPNLVAARARSFLAPTDALGNFDSVGMEKPECAGG
jgi:acyl-CoA thioester hydrolase